jgi:small subunit ribosomal protein S19e
LPTVYNVPTDEILKRTAEYLKKNVSEVSPPQWAAFIKTGSHREKTPQNPDWWYIRSASLLRKIYVNGPIGISRLRKEYGGRSKKGNVGKHERRGGGAVIRIPLQQLEKAGLVKKVEKKGRMMTDKGVSLLDSLAAEIQRQLEKNIPELRKYS